MKTHNKLPTVLLLLIVLVFLSHSLLMGLVPAFGATTNAPVKRALLIGIGKYEILPRLPGSKNDIALVRQVLMSRYGFSDENVHDRSDASRAANEAGSTDDTIHGSASTAVAGSAGKNRSRTQQ